jgi:hypothetical protein
MDKKSKGTFLYYLTAFFTASIEKEKLHWQKRNPITAPIEDGRDQGPTPVESLV